MWILKRNFPFLKSSLCASTKKTPHERKGYRTVKIQYGSIISVLKFASQCNFIIVEHEIAKTSLKPVKKEAVLAVKRSLLKCKTEIG